MKTTWLCVIVAGLALGVSRAEEGTFPFPISPLAGDGSLGVIDLAFLNEAPAGKSGFVRVEGEHFVDGAGKPLRLFGTNVVAASLFPKKDEAPKLARHLAGLGMNVVRLHFLDNQWGGDSLLKPPGYKEYNLDALDRWHFFVNELKKNGVYVNINLHVGRTYEGSPKTGSDFSKGIDLFYPPYAEAFKDYCRFVLGTRNPYTGLAPKDDPGVAVLELNNENTLVSSPWWLLKLPEPFLGELTGQWNAFLTTRYKTQAALEKAYGVTTGEPGPNVGPALEPKSWRRDDGSPEKSTLEPLEGVAGVRWTILKPGAQAWSHQLSGSIKGLKNGERVRVTYRGRAPGGHTLSLSFMMDEAPWSNAGFNDSDELTGEWKTFEHEFSVHDVDGKRVRWSFNAANTPGTVELADFSFRPLPPGFLRPDQSLEKKNVPLPAASAPDGVRSDFFHFLAETEIGWATRMKAFLKTELGVKAPIAHSHVLFGGLLGARREAMVGDFVDNHMYWQHPEFPRRAWDMKDWRIKNTSQVLDREGGVMAELAMNRPAGKPYTVSEYDVPAPSDFAAELWPMISTTACQQGWAGLYGYCFTNSAKAWEGGKIHGFFDTCGHPAKHGLVPLGALVYRLGLVQPLTATAALSLPEEWRFSDATRTNGDMWGSWRRGWAAVGQKGSLAVDARTSLIDGSTVTLDQRPAHESPAVHWDGVAGRWTVSEPLFRAALGRLSEQSVALGDLGLQFAKIDGNGHGCVAAVALDSPKPASLKAAKKVLLVALQRAENEGMGWNEGRTSVGDRWGGGPAQVAGITADVTLPGDGWTVQALDSQGRPSRKIAVKARTFRIEPAAGTLWYWLTRP